MAKVLWISDAGCNTGFARVTHAIGDRLVEQYGHDISVLACNYRGDYWPTKMKLYVPTLRVGTDINGLSRVREMLREVEPEVVVMLMDAPILLQFLFDNAFDEEKLLLQRQPVMTYIPVDGYNRPKLWNVLAQATNVIAMSKFGQDSFEDPAKKLHAQMAYHGVDTDQFWPVSPERPITLENGKVLKSKQDCKRAFPGLDPDGFLVLRVDKNSARKDFAATWSSLVPFMRRHQEVQTHFHCERTHPEGVSLPNLFERSSDEAGIDIRRWFVPDNYNTFRGWPQVRLNALINAANLFVSNSRGEGFGLTLAEAAACGVPIIAQNVSAIPEVVGPGGVLIEPERTITVASGEDLYLSNREAFTDAVEDLYLHKRKREELGEAGRKHVEATFRWDDTAALFNGWIEGWAEFVRKALASKGVTRDGSTHAAEAGVAAV